MTTITRQQLRDAIEAGITAVDSVEGFTPEHATALRVVGTEAMVVARGGFVVGGVHCPVSLAFPDWAITTGAWHRSFAGAYDMATWEAIGEKVGVNVLYVTDEDSTEGEAA